MRRLRCDVRDSIRGASRIPVHGRRKQERRAQFEVLEQRLALSTYYVSPTGNDNNGGSELSPFATLQHAMIALQPGDTLDVESGPYPGFIAGWDSTPATSGDSYGYIRGTAGNPITIQADPTALPGSVIIDSRNNETAVGIDLEPGCDYIKLTGFTIEDSDGSITREGIKVTGNNDSLIDDTVSGVGGFGILADNANNVLIQGSTITGTTGSGDTGHGIYISGSTNGAVVEGNTIADNAYIGIHLNGDASEGGLGLVTDALIADNVIYGNGQNGINADGLQNSIIENNLIYNYQGYGICLYQVDASAGSSNNVIVNNTIDAGTTGSGAAVRILDASTGNTILNNILLGAGGITLRISSDSMSGLVSNDNVVGSVFESEDTGDTETLALWQSQTGQDENSLIATPAQLFVNASGNNFHPLATSPAIDSGTSTDAPPTDLDGDRRPAGEGYDIGCYEYQTGPLAPPLVVSETPASNAMGVPITVVVTATFNEPVQAGTISFLLTGPNDTTVPTTVSYSSATETATLAPDSLLAPSTRYTVSVSGATNPSGDAMYDLTTWSFSTAMLANAPPVVVTKVEPVLNRRHLVTEILVAFSGPVDGAEAQDVGIYRLTIAGARGSFTAKKARNVKIRSAIYQVATNTVTLNLTKRIPLSKPVQLQVDGQPPSGLQVSLGGFIDGGRNVVAVLRRGGVTINV